MILNKSCYDVLPSLDNNSIDLIAIDPPYNIDYADFDKEKLNWPFLFEHFKRILKDTGNLFIFQGWSNICETISIGNKYFKLNDWIIYDRIKGRGAKRRFVSTREDLLWFVKTDKYTFNKIPSTIKKKTGGSIGKRNGNEFRALSNVWTDISPIVPWSKERVDHPTQKPIQIMERIVSIFSNENDMVLDCFMGSGTTGVACRKLNRRFIGIEIDKGYFEIAKNRIEAFNKLFKSKD